MSSKFNKILSVKDYLFNLALYCILIIYKLDYFRNPDSKTFFGDDEYFSSSSQKNVVRYLINFVCKTDDFTIKSYISFTGINM